MIKKLSKLSFAQYVLILTALITCLSIIFSYRSPFSKHLRSGEQINGLLIGTDWVDYARHSDTLVFFSYNPKERFLNIVSIPRDTHFTPPGYTFRRINEIYAYQYRKTKNDTAASKELISAVELLLQNKVKIDYFIQVDYSSFRKFIDLIGGLTIEVEEPMHYDDNAGNLHIHFEPGIHHLNGQKALEFVRFRGPSGDVGRVFRQQRFMKAVLSKWKNPLVLFSIPKIVKIMISEIKTNLSLWDMLNGAIELKDLKIKNVRLAQLPGKPNRMLWEPDHENISGLLNKILAVDKQDLKANSKVRVEIWNAAGQPGLAEKIAWLFRKNGFDVMDWGNYETIQKKTIIKDLTGDTNSAQKISEILACGEVITRYDEKRFVDISVILGEDCKVPEK